MDNQERIIELLETCESHLKAISQKELLLYWQVGDLLENSKQQLSKKRKHSAKRGAKRGADKSYRPLPAGKLALVSLLVSFAFSSLFLYLMPMLMEALSIW